ncbi:MAG TPA: hypothetical protein VHJ20_14680 [Polyangia bacterium]|nr:hypothetical protein [Polyangia bacterium]
MRGANVGLVLLALLAACGDGTPASRHARLYALSTGDAGQTGGSNHALTIIDLPTWKVTRTVAVPGAGRAFLARDPSGRLWVTHHGPDNAFESGAELFSPEGDKLADVATCKGGHRAVFGMGDAWVACEENDFQGALAQIDLGTLAPVTAVPTALRFPESDVFAVTSAGLMGSRIVVAGAVNTGSGVLVLDGSDAAPRSILFGAANFGTALSHGEDAVLLNAESGLVRPPGTIPDVIKMSGSPVVVTNLTAAPSPQTGVVVGDALYVAGQVDGVTSPTFARVAVGERAGAGGPWPTSLRGQAAAMATDGTAVFVALERPDSDDADGLYELDTGTGALTLRLALADVTDLAFAPPSASGN